MASKIFESVRDNISDDSRQFVSNSFNILNYIHYLLDKQNITQKELALKLNISESEISNILSPGYNITLKTLSKIEVALGEKIIISPNFKPINEELKLKNIP